VFEDGRGLDDATMQAIALQFNLSETTFILPSTAATARVRIFTPSFEMPFAGHPTLGTAHVVRSLFGGDAVTLEMKAGIIPVASQGDRWTLTANAPHARPVDADAATLAGMLGIAAEEIAAGPMWVDTGSEQLIVPLERAEAVRRCNPSSALLPSCPRTRGDRAMARVWAHSDAENILARSFFTKGSMIAEDPGTGSACANLGGWFITRGQQGPLSRRIRQGEAVGRPCVLGLDIDATQRIHV